MDSSDTTICTAEQINHSYGSRTALTDISFTLPQGTVIGLVGANGSGKSTLLRILSGVQRPTSGTTFLFGENLADSEAAGRGLGAAVDGMALWPGWSVQQNLRYIAGLCGATNEQIDDAAALVDIAAEMKTRLRRLSLGNRQRVLLAAAILAGTSIVLMDEPMNGLDPDTRQRIREVIIMLAGQGKTVLLSSHDLHDVESLCSQLIVLDDGHLMFAGQTTDFVGASTMTILRMDSDATGRAQVLLTDAGIHCRRDTTGAPVVFTHEATAATRVLATAGISVLAADERHATLEEKFHDRL